MFGPFSYHRDSCLYVSTCAKSSQEGHSRTFQYIVLTSRKIVERRLVFVSWIIWLMLLRFYFFTFPKRFGKDEWCMTGDSAIGCFKKVFGFNFWHRPFFRIEFLFCFFGTTHTNNVFTSRSRALFIFLKLDWCREDDMRKERNSRRWYSFLRKNVLVAFPGFGCELFIFGFFLRKSQCVLSSKY